MPIEFEWDATKALRNFLKHGVRFDEAETVFGDALGGTSPDETTDVAERRYTTIGRSRLGRLLVVVHTERGARIRIIGARLATPRERRKYEGKDGA